MVAQTRVVFADMSMMAVEVIWVHVLPFQRGKFVTRRLARPKGSAWGNLFGPGPV